MVLQGLRLSPNGDPEPLSTLGHGLAWRHRLAEPLATCWKQV